MSALLFWSRLNSDSPLYSPYRSQDVATGAQVVNRSSGSSIPYDPMALKEWMLIVSRIVAALAFLAWDILITTDDEVKLIWPRTWSYTKYVYFILRYIPLLVQISILFVGSELTPHFHFTPHDCYVWQIYQGVAASFIVATVDTVLILRVHALYHGHRIIRWLVAVFYALEITGMAIGLALSLPGITYDNICVVVGVPHSLIVYGASSIIFQFFLFGLTLYKFIEAARSGWGDVPLIVLLMRDGTWAFFLLFVVYVGQLCLYALPNHAFAGVLFGWLLTAFSFCGYRILHNLNRFAEHAIEGAESHGSGTRPTNTNIQFSTQIFHSQRETMTRGQGQEDSYELSGYSHAEYSRVGKRTIESSQISTLSLGS